MKDRKGTQGPPVPQIWYNSIISGVTAFWKNWKPAIFLWSAAILNLLVEPNRFPLCQGKGQRSQRAKNRTEPFPCKIGRGILNLVALALMVTELLNKVYEKVKKETKKQSNKQTNKELRRQVKNKTYPLLWGYVNRCRKSVDYIFRICWVTLFLLAPIVGVIILRYINSLSWGWVQSDGWVDYRWVYLL